MKKNLKNVLGLTVLIASISVASQGLAKTEGSYLGLDLLHVNAKHKYARSGAEVRNYSEFDNSSTGYGVNYKYAFNFNNFFLAPTLFYEDIGTEAQDKDKDTVSIKNRYGAKLDFGYDFSQKLAVYVTGGLASVGYSVDWKSIDKKNSDREIGALLGLGVSYYPHKNLALNLEYNIQRLTFSTPNSQDALLINEVDTDVNVVKIGASYHF